MPKPETIPVSKFKATCLGVLDKVSRTGKPVLVTKFGKPIAEVVPVRERKPAKEWVGSMVDTGRILGDLVSPAIPEKDWDVFNE